MSKSIATASASPAKRFFVEMLTRDIELQDAILDLLDNCVDGAMRQTKNRKVDAMHPYKGFCAWIKFDGQSFSVTDNCGGIPRDIAEQYAFRMGRPDENRDPELATVGVYGIGMKRAIFKMGRAASVNSQTAKGKGFEVVIDSEWLDDDDDWNLPINDVPDSLDRPGTIIEVHELKDSIARLLSNDTDFHKELEKAISAYYGYIIEKGFSVKLNGKEVVPLQVALLFDKDSFERKEGIAPYAYKLNLDGVSVQLAVGMYRDLPSDAEEEEALLGRPTTERAGWTVICNDRVVMYADKSRVTGWGEAGVPSYHTQFVSIAGVVIFKSNDPTKLPITTTKRGIDGNSELYLGVKEYMREGLKVFTDFTNKWKNSSPERSEIKGKAASTNAGTIPALVPTASWTTVSKGMGGSRFKPNLPVPKETDPMKQIRFSRKRSDIQKVANYLFENQNTPVAEVGGPVFRRRAEESKQMSGGGSIPYHLRQNKAIERNLFVDLLNRVGRYKNISDYTYIGFGGPFLEDFKHLHSSLRVSKMVSLEIEEDVFLRQTFNQPVSCVSLRLEKSSDFIVNYDFTDPSIIWFDYASPDITEQLNETQRLVEKLGHGDIFKVTLNANSQTLGTKPGVPIHEHRRDEAIKRLGDYGPPNISEEDVENANYPVLLLNALLSASRRGVRGTPHLCVQPLAAFVYSDGTQMLTFTAIVLSSDERENFLHATRLAYWKFSNLECSKPKSISVPSFSVKERLHVESLLPKNDAAAIIKDLGYSIGEKNSAKILMENFVEFYRLYPWYSRVVM